MSTPSGTENPSGGDDSTPSSPPSYSAYSGAQDSAPADEALLSGGRYPGAGRRLGGYLIDSILIGIIGTILTTIFAGGDISEYMDEIQAWTDAGQPGDGPTLNMGGLILSAFITLLIWFIYRVGLEVRSGQTLGKKLLGMKVVTEGGSLLSLGASFKRNSWYILTFLLALLATGIGALVALVLLIILGVTIARNPHGQHTFDQWAKAYVINTN